MSQDIYSQIVSLKNEKNDIKRGRDFEALIREIMPWDRRPPIVSSQESEQLDGVFTYQGLTFIIESKAVKKTITPGMHEWEDFALKVSDRREKRVVGLFCCLFDISETVIQKARDLNLRGMQTIVIFGKTWDDLNETGLFFPAFVDYMLQLTNVKNTPSLDSIKNAKNWIYDVKTINQHFANSSKKISGPFLRRFKHKYHEQIFVQRQIDSQIKSHLKAITPHALKSKRSEDEVKQVLIVRDYSGSGKTTLSTNLAITSENAYCLATTANLTTIDLIIDTLLDHTKYPNSGLDELMAVNKPFLFIIDSLDETPFDLHVNKRHEIRSLFKRVEELNVEAKKLKMSAYPIMLMFTIREDYWRDWEAAFEGRQEIIYLRKMLSNFNKVEFEDAFQRYSCAYDYSVTNNLSASAKEILSVPINLEIFSEANHYDGDIVVNDIWEGKILSSYFSKKEEAMLSKHYTSNLDSDKFYNIICALSYKLLTDKSTLFSKVQFRTLVHEKYSEGLINIDQLLLNLISEQIIINDTDNLRSYRFKYIRFVEYLIALFIIREVEKTEDYKFIDTTIQVIYDSKFVSIYSVLNNIKHICRTQFTELEDEIIDYYSHSDTFLKKYLPELRGKIARGEYVSEDAIKSIITNNYIQSSQTAWDTFFIVAAKNLNATKEIILSAFTLAWDTSKGNNTRWKLVNRLSTRGLLIEERVLNTLFKDANPKEFEEYLGSVLVNKLHTGFLELWQQIEGEKVLSRLRENSPLEWNYVNRLLDLIHRNEGYVLGDILSDEPSRQYIVFETQRTESLPILNTEEKRICDAYVDEFNSVFKGLNSNSYVLASRLKELGKDAQKFINLSLGSILNNNHPPQNLPFLNFIIRNAPETNSIIRMTLENPHLDLHIQDSVSEISLFHEILDSDYKDKTELFQFIFTRGYKTADSDEKLISRAIEHGSDFTSEEFESILIGYCFLKIRRKDDYAKVRDIYREICTLLTFKFDKIIYFRFSNIIQVANNALEHYNPFGKLFLLALAAYGKLTEFEAKPSFKKKSQAYDNEKTLFPPEYTSVISNIFQELF